MKNYLLIILIFLIIFNANIVLAVYDFEKESGIQKTGSEAGYSGFYGKERTLPQIIGLVIQAGLALLGIIFLGLMIYGGYTWMMARGNEQEVEKAKNIIKNALIGLIVVLAAYAITKLIMSNIHPTVV